MGSTITIGKHAAALQSNGVTYFLLTEKTYESNVSPKTPHWSAVYFGPLQGALQHIFGHASSTEGGMLRGPTQRMRPENYITAWLRALRNPTLLPDDSIRLDVGERAVLSPASLEKAADILRANGADDIAATISPKGFTNATLSIHAQAIAALLAANLTNTWRLFPNPPVFSNQSAPELGYNPGPSTKPDPELPNPIVYRLREYGEELIMKDDKNCLRPSGWTDSVVGEYVRQIAKLQIEHPGFYKTAIPHYRNILTKAPTIPSQTRALATCNPTDDDYRISIFVSARKLLGLSAEPTDFEFTLDNPKAVEAINRLDTNQITFRI